LGREGGEGAREGGSEGVSAESNQSSTAHAQHHNTLPRHLAHNARLTTATPEETRNCGYYTQQSLTAPQNCEWLH